MEQGYLFKAKDQDHYSYGHPKRIISYKLFRKVKSHGIRLDYADGGYDIFEEFISEPIGNPTYRRILKP